MTIIPLVVHTSELLLLAIIFGTSFPRNGRWLKPRSGLAND
jgi:hypothetical protein